MSLALALQSGDTLFKLGLVQQVGISRKNSHIFREVHTALLVHRALVDSSRPKSARFKLVDECCLALQKIELVRVQRLLDGIYNDVDIVSGEILGNLIAGSDGSTVTLLQVTRAPGSIKVMDRDTTLLCVDSGAKHLRRAEQDTHVTSVHGLDHVLTVFIGLALLNESDFIGRNPVILHKLTLDFGIDIPLAGLIRAEVAENELSALLGVVTLIIIGNHLGAMAGLVVDVIGIRRVNHPHIESHLTRIVGGDKHLGFFLRL